MRRVGHRAKKTGRKRKGPGNTPHDGLVKQALSNPLVARRFLARHLPAEIVQHLKLSELRAEDRHFVRAGMRLLHADALFSVPYDGKPSFVYVTVEHSARPGRWTPLQVLLNSCEIMATYHREHPKARFSPMVLPLILYSGPEPYSYSTSLLDLIDGPRDLVAATFTEPIRLIQLREEDDEDLKKEKLLAAYLLSLKHAWDEIPVSTIIALLGALSAEEEPLRHFRVLCGYWSVLNQDLNPEDLLK